MTEYAIPTSVEEAINLLAAHHGQALIIAGGTDVLPDIRKGKHTPRCLIDVTRIPELTKIQVRDSYVEVGAAVTFAMLREHPFLCEHIHALIEAAGSVGAPGIQNAATWAGNIVQAMPAADGAIVAIALDAEVLVVDASAAAWRPVETLFAGPGRSTIDPARQLVTRIRFPIPGRPWGTAWRRIGRRAALVLPILNCAVRLELADGRIERAAIALGPVAPTPYRARQAEVFLAGQAPTPEAFCEAARIATGEANPRSSIMRASREYRLAVLPVMVSDALAVAAGRAEATAAFKSC